MSTRSDQLAMRIEAGADTLSAFAQTLTDKEWATVVKPDGRTVGVIVHHVGSMYPIEMDVIGMAVKGTPIVEVTWDMVADINAKHAKANKKASKSDALAVLRTNSRAAAAAIRAMSDADLDRAVPFSLSSHAPLTTQYVIEDHPLKHPWHHLARIKNALKAKPKAKTKAKKKK